MLTSKGSKATCMYDAPGWKVSGLLIILCMSCVSGTRALCTSGWDTMNPPTTLFAMSAKNAANSVMLCAPSGGLVMDESLNLWSRQRLHCFVSPSSQVFNWSLQDVVVSLKSGPDLCFFRRILQLISGCLKIHRAPKDEEGKVCQWFQDLW